MQAAAELVEELGGEVVKMLFLIELAGLNGRKLLSKYDVDAVVSYLSLIHILSAIMFFIASSGTLPSRMMVFQLSLFWCHPGTVSYTHLDVYKRQGQP